MRRVAIVTGVTGFVGSHLAESLLADDVRVVGVARSSRWPRGAEHLADKVPLHIVELEDGMGVAEVLREERPDEIYHLAGMASVPACIRDPDAAWRSNFHGSQNVFTAAERETPNARLLFVSTGAVYGKPLGDELPISERSRLSPATAYAQSKLAADLLALRLAQERNLPFMVVRSFNHIGPRQQGEFAIAEFASQIARLENEPEGKLRCGRLDVLRDFLDVRDVVRAYRALLRLGTYGDVYNLASGTTQRLGDMLGELLGMARRQIEVEEQDSRLRGEEPAAVTVDPTKLMACTGWEPTHAIQQTLRDTLDYCRTVHALETQARGAS